MLNVVLLLLAIVIACQVFTNAVENLGEKLGLSKQFTGSVLAAVGTALPETILPLVAIIAAWFAHDESAAAKNDIALGAIVGAPFMLATLAMFLIGLSILVNKKKRGVDYLNIDIKHFGQDLQFFLLAYALAIVPAFIQSEFWIDTFGELGASLLRNIKFSIAVLLIAIYIFYVYMTIKYESDHESDFDDGGHPELYFRQIYFKRFNPFAAGSSAVKPASHQEAMLRNDFVNPEQEMPNETFWTFAQLGLGLLMIILTAHEFVHAVEDFSHHFDMSPLILSLIISPIATELPEKVNSWVWSSEGKDTLAMGNISGAMVFQAAIPCVIGILLTPWQLNSFAMISYLLTIISAVFLWILTLRLKRIPAAVLLSCGLYYLVYLAAIFLL